MASPIWNRRDWLGATAAATAGIVAGCAAPRTADPRRAAPSKAPTPFQHRGYLGWITDLASRPDPQAPWPSMRLDDALLADYREAFRRLRHAGFNQVVIWGFYVANQWPDNPATAVTAERGRRVEQLITDAHGQGLRVLSGLGVYSWGFADLIRRHPLLNRGNPNVLCGSLPESWEWQRRVTDFVLQRFPIDGVSLQSADQGRCQCERCRRWTDAEYHAELVLRTAGHIRSQHPGQTVAVSSWGMDFSDPANHDALRRMAGSLDYLVDFNDSAARRGPEARRRFLASLPCPGGTLGGPQVEPPQHWERDRWFLPTCRRVGEHLVRLAEDGGGACEFFFHPLANPGGELTVEVAGRTLADPARGWEAHLKTALEELYRPRSTTTRDGLAEFFLAAEDAWFRWRKAGCGTISLEPLVGDRPGPPVYLGPPFDAAARAQYAADLAGLLDRLKPLESGCRDRSRFERIRRGLQGAIRDARA